jgi:hypothetical protein
VLFRSYVTRILKGNYSFAFDQSAGPAHHFFIAPLIALLGGSYLSYKIASIMTGGIAIVLLFYCGKMLLGPSEEVLPPHLPLFRFGTFLFVDSEALLRY